MYQQVFQLHEKLYKALANQKRVEIIHLLRDQELSVSNMQEMLGLPQANLSQHLAVLRKHGLVRFRRNGKTIYYKLSHDNLIQASDLIREMLIDQNRGDAKLAEELRLRMKDFIPLVNDPVCGMRLSPKTAATALKIDGKTYYFCATGCKERYLRRKYKRARLTKFRRTSEKSAVANLIRR